MGAGPWPPDITALPDLAAALGVSVDELLAGEAAAGQPPVPEKAQAPQAPALGLGEKVPQGPLFCVEDIFAPSALSLAARAGGILPGGTGWCGYCLHC